ncbi:MAG: hypothetical protein IPP46_18480 [Bacteroidetes bacterium]|nr:hypothetical protein [Bacteroidota bacterium]
MQQLDIKNIEVHAYHGCLPEEAKIGSLFAVDVSFEGITKFNPPVNGSLGKAVFTVEE